jgi:hypothetical protein
MQTLREPLRHNHRPPAVGWTVTTEVLGPLFVNPRYRRAPAGARCRDFKRPECTDSGDIGRGSTPKRAQVETSIDSVGRRARWIAKAQP